MNGIPALLALASVASLASPAMAQPAVEKVANDFATVCGGAIEDVEVGAAAAVKLGYGTIERAEVNKVSKAISVNGPEGGFSIATQGFFDMANVSCTLTVMGFLSIADIEAIAAKFAELKSIGELEGGAGSPQGSTNPAGMIFGTYKRPGNDPLITVNSLTTAQFSNISVSLTRLTNKD